MEVYGYVCLLELSDKYGIFCWFISVQSSEGSQGAKFRWESCFFKNHNFNLNNNFYLIYFDLNNMNGHTHTRKPQLNTSPEYFKTKFGKKYHLKEDCLFKRYRLATDLELNQFEICDRCRWMEDSDSLDVWDMQYWVTTSGKRIHCSGQCGQVFMFPVTLTTTPVRTEICSRCYKKGTAAKVFETPRRKQQHRPKYTSKTSRRLNFLPEVSPNSQRGPRYAPKPKVSPKSQERFDTPEFDFPIVPDSAVPSEDQEFFDMDTEKSIEDYSEEEEEQSTEEYSEEEEKIYTTPTGKKYHKYRGCTALGRSKHIQEVVLSQKGKRTLCSTCKKHT